MYCYTSSQLLSHAVAFKAPKSKVSLLIIERIFDAFTLVALMTPVTNNNKAADLPHKDGFFNPTWIPPVAGIETINPQLKQFCT